MIKVAIKVDLLQLEVLFDLLDWIFAHFFKLFEKAALKVFQEVVDVKELIGAFEVAFKLVDRFKCDDLERIDQLVVLDLCHEYLCQVLLVLVTFLDDVDILLNRLTSISDNIFE